MRKHFTAAAIYVVRVAVATCEAIRPLRVLYDSSKKVPRAKASKTVFESVWVRLACPVGSFVRLSVSQVCSSMDSG